MRRICVVGSRATPLLLNGCARCVARRLLASAPPGKPNLSTSTLIGLLGDIRAKESPLESYLPGPCQRLFAGLRDRVAERHGRHHAPAVRDQPAARFEPRAGMEDENAGWHLRQAADLKARL